MNCTGSRYVGRAAGGNHSGFVPCTEVVTMRRTERNVVSFIGDKLSITSKVHNLCKECASLYDEEMAERAFEARWS
jgi:hypothetical protein